MRLWFKSGYSLRDLYRTLETPGANPLRDAHAALDAACGMPADADPLACLLALNLTLAAKEKPASPLPRLVCRCPSPNAPPS